MCVMPLATLLSQVLVAFTIEFDNEFERRMRETSFPGARLSLVVWSNLMRFVAGTGVSVRELQTKALASQERIKFELGCLERWGFVVLQQDSADDRSISMRTRGPRGDQRDGWGSARRIRADWVVRLTAKGVKAAEIWQQLLSAIERRWRMRFGAIEINYLRESAQAVVDQLDVELPHALPNTLQGDKTGVFPPRTTWNTAQLPLPTLLSRMLLAFTIEFDRESQAPLALCKLTLCGSWA